MPSEPTAPLALRLRAQLLSGPAARHPVAVAERLLAVQGQDIRGARLAVRARTNGVTAADVDAALGDRSLLITWLNRGTLHLIRSEDYPLLQALTTPQLATGNARRLAQEGVSPAAADRGVKVIESSLTNDGPLTRPELRDRLDAANIPTAGQALVHLLMLACLRGISVRGPVQGSQHAYVLVRDWLPPAPAPPEPVLGFAELARRYLLGHGPANDRDLAQWAGITLRDARAGLAALGEQLHEGADGLLTVGPRGRAPALPRPKLLGQFDPVLLGWASKEPVLGPHAHRIVDNGLFRPFAMLRGRAVGIWRIERGDVTLDPFEPLARADRQALDADAADIRRFLSSAEVSAGGSSRSSRSGSRARPAGR